MPLPEVTAKFLYAKGSWPLPGSPVDACEGSVHHSPRPMFTRLTALVLRDWWPEETADPVWNLAPKVMLCGTCRDNLTMLMQIYYATDGHPPWEVAREFGNTIRMLVNRGWVWYEKHRPMS